MPGQPVPELDALLALWRRRYDGRPIPERSRFEPSELGPWGAYAAWIESGNDDTFRVRTFGIELIRRFGREATNYHVEDLALDIATSLREILLRAVASRAPAAAGASVQFGHAAALFSELALPLASDSRRVNLLLLVSYELKAGKTGHG